MDHDQFTGLYRRALVAASLKKRALPEGLIYHYTTPEGLLGILTDKRIRATDFRHLNDSREMLAGLEVAGPLIADAVQDGLTCLKSDVGKEDIWPALDALQGNNFDEWLSDHSVFVASCSQPGDSLPQWREYGGRCAGFSIGIQPRAVMGGSTIGKFDLFKCVYRPEELSTILTTRTQGIFEALKTALQALFQQHLPDEERFERTSTLVRWTSVSLNRLKVEAAVCYKDPGFTSEEEWRFVGGPPVLGRADKPEFRASLYGITPYIELDLPTGSIKEIIVGPKFCTSGQVLEATQQGVEELLRHRFWDGVEIVPSTLSVR